MQCSCVGPHNFVASTVAAQKHACMATWHEQPALPRGMLAKIYTIARDQTREFWLLRDMASLAVLSRALLGFGVLRQVVRKPAISQSNTLFGQI